MHLGHYRGPTANLPEYEDADIMDVLFRLRVAENWKDTQQFINSLLDNEMDQIVSVSAFGTCYV